MKQKKISSKEVKEYMAPEIESLKALLMNFHLQKTLKVLMFLEYVFKIEISARRKKGS